MSEQSATEVTESLLRGWPLSGPGEGKDESGRVLVVAGSRTTPGAAVLAVEGLCVPERERSSSSP